MPSKWSEVAADPDFQNAPVETKMKLRDEYFNGVIAPEVPKEALDAVKKDFYERSESSFQRPYERQQIRSTGKTQSEADALPFYWDALKKGVASVPVAAKELSDIVFKPWGNSPDPYEQITGKKHFELSPEVIKKASESALGVKNFPPTTAMQKLFQVPAEFVGSAAIPEGFLLKGAAKAGHLGRAALTESGSVAAGGIGTGVGQKMGEEIAGKDEEKRKKYGMIGAGTLGLVAGGGIDAMLGPNLLGRAGSAVSQGVRNLWDKIGGHKPSEADIEKVVGPKIAEYLRKEPGALDRLDEAMRTAQRIEGYNPDLAQATGAAAIVALKEAASKHSMEAATRFEAITQKNKEAIDAFAKSKFSSTGVEPYHVAREKVEQQIGEASADIYQQKGKMMEHDLRTKGELQAFQKMIEEQIVQTEAAISDLGKGFSRVHRKTEQGERLADLSKQLGQLQYAKSQAMYREVYVEASKLGIKADMADVVDYVNQSLRSRSRYFDKKPEVFHNVLDFQKQHGTPAAPARETVQMRQKYTGPTDAQIKAERAKTLLNVVKKKTGMTEAGVRKAIVEGDKYAIDTLISDLVNEEHFAPMSPEDFTGKLFQEIHNKVPTYPTNIDQDLINALPKAEREAKAEKEFVPTIVKIGAKEAGLKMSVEELHNLMINAKRDARNMRIDDERRPYLVQLSKMLDEKFKQLESGNALSGKLKEANNWWLESYKKPYIQGAGGKMRADGKYGDMVDRGQIFDQLFIGKGERGADDFIRMFGDSPEAQQINYRMVSSNFIESATKSGRFNVKDARAFLSKDANRRYLDGFPELKTELENIVGSGEKIHVENARDLKEFEQELKSRQDMVKEENSRLISDLKDLETKRKKAQTSEFSKVAGTENTDKLIRTAISDRGYAKFLTALVKDNELAQAGLAHGIAQIIINEKNPESFLLANEKSLKPMMDALGPDHWENIKTIAQADRQMASGGRVAFSPGTGIKDPVESILGTSSSGLFSRIRSMVYRYSSPEYLIFDIGGKYVFKMKRDAAQEFLEKVLTDPTMARRVHDMYKDEKIATQSAADVISQGIKTAGDKAREIYEELKPHMKLHGLRVGMYVLNIPTEQARRNNQSRKSDSDVTRQMFGISRIDGRGDVPMVGR